MPKNVDALRKSLNKKKKGKTFPVGYVKMCLWKESTMIKLFNTHQVKMIGKFVTPGLDVTVARLKNAQKTNLKTIPTLFMRLLRR